MFLQTAQDTCFTAVPNLQLTNWPTLQEDSFSKFTIVFFNVCQIGRCTARLLWFYWRLEPHPVPSEVNGCLSSPYSRTWMKSLSGQNCFPSPIMPTETFKSSSNPILWCHIMRLILEFKGIAWSLKVATKFRWQLTLATSLMLSHAWKW